VSDWRLLFAADDGRGLRDYRIWLIIVVLAAAGLWFAMR
jgi:hypothetical protein